MNALFDAHSGIRDLLLLIGVMVAVHATVQSVQGIL